MGSASAVRKAGVHRRGEWWHSSKKVIEILVSAEWLGSREAGDLPSGLCLESWNNFG